MHIAAWWLFFLVSVKYYSHNNGLFDKYRGLFITTSLEDFFK